MNTNVFFRQTTNLKTAIAQRNIFQFLDQIFNLKIARVMNLILLLGVGNVWGQTTLLIENIGTSTAGTTPISSNTFQNSSPILFSGTSDTRTSTASSGYAGSSGGRNVFITNTVGINFIISGINTTGYGSLTLSFGHYKSTTASNNGLLVESEDEKALFDAMKLFIDKKVSFSKPEIAQNAQKRYSVEAISSKFIKLYQKIA